MAEEDSDNKTCKTQEACGVVCIVSILVRLMALVVEEGYAIENLQRQRYIHMYK
jgi:hypothetical protein